MRSRYLIAGLLLALAMAPSLWLLISNPDFPQFGIFSDDSVYFLNGASLAEGRGYHILSQPGTPYQTKYPPLFPLFLSIAWKLQPRFPQNLPAALKLVWLLIPPFVVLCWRVLRDYGLGPVEAAGLCLWIGFCPLFNLMSLSLLSELFASVFILTSILLAERASDQNSMVLSLGAGLAGAACCLIKTGALPILISAPVAFWLARRKRLAIPYLIGSVPFAVAWQAWVALHKTPSSDEYVGSYLTYLGQMNLARVFLVNFDQVLTGLAGFLFFLFSEQWWGELLAWVACIAGAVGIGRLVRRSGRWHFAMFAAGYTGLMIIWNWIVGPRMAFELLPIAAAGIYFEAKHFTGLCAANFRRGIADRCAAAVMLSLVAAFAIFSAARIYDGLTSYVPGVIAAQRTWWQASAPVFDWIRENTPPDARFYANNETMLYLRSGRRGFNMPLPPPLRYESPARKAAYFSSLPQAIHSHGATHALLLLGDLSPDLGDNGRNVALSALESDPSFRQIFRYPEAVVYEVHPPGTLAASQP